MRREILFLLIGFVLLISGLVVLVHNLFWTEESSQSLPRSIVIKSGIGTVTNDYLYATLADHWQSHYICSGYGSNFYSPEAFYPTAVTLCLFRTNGTTDGPLTVTANMSVYIYATSAQNYSGLPVGNALDISNPVNASTLAGGYQSGGYYYGPFTDVNFTFPTEFTLQSGEYYSLALQIDDNGHIYWDNSGLYGQVGILDWNTTMTSYTPFINPVVSGAWWGSDVPAYDCGVEMAIYGYCFQKN